MWKVLNVLFNIEFQNILPDSNLVIEKMNELGIHLFKLEKELNKEESKLNLDIALIRKKIVDKRILKSQDLTDTLQNSGRG